MNITLYLFIGAKAYMGAFGIGNFVLYISTIERFISAISDLFQTVSMLSSNIPYLRDEFSYLDMPNNMYQGTLKVEKRAFVRKVTMIMKLNFGMFLSDIRTQKLMPCAI